jgi:alpha-beta hydrolase superfamily lysophospholipase
MLPLAEALAHLGTAYVLDFRGHGASGGRTTLGDLEALDVRAVVSLARRECGASACVVSVGSSMGGIAVLRDAAEFASADAVVSISAPAVWTGQRRRTRLLGMLANESCGALARAAAFWARPWNRAGRTRRRRSSSSATSTSRCCSCTARPTRSWHRTSRAC